MGMSNHIVDLVRFSDLEAIALLMGWEKKPALGGRTYYYLLEMGPTALRFRKTTFGGFTLLWGYLEERTVLEQSLTKEKLQEIMSTIYGK